MSDPVTIDPPPPKRSKRGQPKPKLDVLEEGTNSCRNCAHFHPGDGKLDNADWGECWKDPQTTQFWQDEDGNERMTGSKAIQILPYYCGHLKPRH